MPDDDFMGSSFDNYDTTENRMSDSASGSGGHSGSTGEKHFEVLGRCVSTGRIAAGMVTLIVCAIIAVASKVDGEYGLVSAIFIFGGLIAFFLIALYKEKSLGKGMTGGRKARLRELMDFIEEEGDTDLGRRLKRLLDHIDKTDLVQVNRIWRETPAGKKEMEELDKFNETHPN